MICSTCGKDGRQHKLQRCSGCKLLHYCSSVCQRADWTAHRAECKDPSGCYNASVLCSQVAAHLVASHGQRRIMAKMVRKVAAQHAGLTLVYGLAVRVNHAWEGRLMLRDDVLFNCNFLTDPAQCTTSPHTGQYVLMVEVKEQQLEEQYQRVEVVLNFEVPLPPEGGEEHRE